MNVQEFLQNIENAPPGPVTLFCPHKSDKAREASYEPLLAERAIERVVTLYLDPTLKDMAYNAYFADEADPAEIVSVAETLPFLSERRFVVVRRAECYLSESHCGPLLTYLGNPCESTVLLFVADTIDRRSKFYRACKALGSVVPCPKLRQNEVRIWINAEAKTRQKRIAPEAVQALIDRAGTRLGDVQNALNVVCDYVGTKQLVEAEDVKAACSDVAEEQIWTLTDAIAASDTQKAVCALRELLDLGLNELQILGTLNWLLKSAHAVAARTPGLPRMSKFVARKVEPLANKLGPEKVRDAFSLCMEAEIMLRSTHVDTGLALELLVIKLAAPTTRRKRAPQSAKR
ncbi:MAG: DNA polymerase III subunit delta [Candidatus Hydrogenedentota bacterium]